MPNLTTAMPRLNKSKVSIKNFTGRNNQCFWALYTSHIHDACHEEIKYTGYLKIISGVKF